MERVHTSYGSAQHPEKVPNLKNTTNSSMQFNISQLPMHVLMKVVQYLPIAQWPALESVDQAFQNATFEAWKKLRQIDLEADFVYNRRLFDEYKIKVLNLLLEKLLVRAPKITALDDFDAFKDEWLDDTSIDLLAGFSHLESIKFYGIRISHLDLARFLNVSRSRCKLKHLDLTNSLLCRSNDSVDLQHGEAELHLAVGQHADLPALQLEYFGYKFGYHVAPSKFLNNIDATNLKGLCLHVGDANQNNLISILNRFNRLTHLELKLKKGSLEMLQSISLPHTLSKLTMEYYAVSLEDYTFLSNFIENLGRDLYQLNELCLSGNHCRDDTVQYIAHNYQHLRSLWLDISVCKVDTVAHLLLAKSERLENLQLRGVNPYCTTAIAPYISQLKNLKCLEISASPKVAIRMEFTLALCKLDQLKELCLANIHIRDGNITHLVKNAKISQLESLDITGSIVSEAAIILLLPKLPNLRKLNLGRKEITDDGLNAIAKSCPFLLELKIPCGKITPAGIQLVIDSCPRLKKISVGCVTDNKYWYPQNLQINKYRKIIFEATLYSRRSDGD